MGDQQLHVTAVQMYSPDQAQLGTVVLVWAYRCRSDKRGWRSIKQQGVGLRRMHLLSSWQQDWQEAHPLKTAIRFSVSANVMLLLGLMARTPPPGR